MRRKLAIFMTLIMIFSMSTSVAFAGTISNVLKASFTVSDQSAATVKTAAELTAALANPSVKAINLAGGIYDGQFIISRTVTINGSTDPANPSIFRPSTQLPVTFSRTINGNSVTYRPVIIVDTYAAPTINNIVIDGNNKGFADTGIGFNKAGGALNSVEIMHITDNPFAGNQRGKGIEAWNDGTSPAALTITGCKVTDYQKGGIYLEGTGLTANVTGCTVTGAGATEVLTQNGILMGYGAQGSITGNTISGNSYVKDDQWKNGACGVLIYNSPTTGITASGNKYSNNDNNFCVSGTDPVTLTGTADGSVIDPSAGVSVNVTDINIEKEIAIKAKVNGLQEFYGAKLVLDFGSNAANVVVKVGADTITADSNGRFEIGNVANTPSADQDYTAKVSFKAAGTYNATIYVEE